MEITQIMLMVILVLLVIIVTVIVMLWSSAKKINILGTTVETIALKEKGTTRKKGVRRALKTVIKAAKSIANQKPCEFLDNSQLKDFTIIIKEGDKHMVYTADGVIGKELMESLEDLGVDWLINKL